MAEARTSILIATILAVALGGCAQGGSFGQAGPPATPAQADLKARADRYEEVVKEDSGPSVGGFAVTGALIGAILAGTAAAMSGAKSRNTAAIAAGGAALGAAGGAALAYEARRYARLEDSLDQKIVAARREASDMRDAASAAERVADEHMARVRMLKQEAAAGRVRQSQVNVEAEAMRADRRRMETALGAADKIRRQMVEDMSRHQGALSLETEIAALDAQSARLRRSIGSVSEALTVVET